MFMQPLFGLPPEFYGILAAIVIFALAIFIVFILLAVKFYKRCPSNRILVIYGKTGKGRSAECIHGGARFIVPLKCDYAYLSLEPMQIEIPLRGALSMENIRVNVPSVFTVAIGTTPDLMQNASIRLLGLSNNEISKQAEDIIFGQLRQVIASMRIEEINRDRETFLGNIQESLDAELLKIGLILINVNITDITDESGYIEAIGQKAASQAIQAARGDVADNEKMGEIRVADAEREKAISVANANKDRMIGTREAERERAVSVAQLSKEQEIGEKQAQYIQEAEVKDREREMRIRLAQADALAIEGENTSKADIAASKAELQVKKAEAYELGERRSREAEAAVAEAEHVAQTKAALAEAARIEAERRAELEAPAKAEKAKTIVEAEAEAERKRIDAEGQAKAIYAKLEAEARGQYEILAKKGEGLQVIIDACGGSDQAFQMMLLEHFDNLVDASAKAISNIKFDKVVVWDGGSGGGDGSGKSATANWLHDMSKTLPPMMQVLKDVGGIEIPETLSQIASVQDLAAETAKKADSGSKPAAPTSPKTAPSQRAPKQKRSSQKPSQKKPDPNGPIDAEVID